MIQAFKKQQPDYDKFDEYLSDVPNKYREELRCDSLSRNSERLYANLYSFFESSYEYRKGQFRQSVICLPRNNINRYFADDKEDIKL